MDKLVPVRRNEEGSVIVSGRDLHEFLGAKERYTQWFSRMTEYGFVENVDFMSLSEKSEKPFGGRPQIDHALTLDMAKEISMIQRTERGKQARQYFIEVEKRYRQKSLRMPETPTEILAVIGKVTQEQDKQIRELDTKVTFLTDLSGLTSARSKELTKARNKKVIQVCGGSDSNAYKDVTVRRKVYQAMFKDYKDRFDVTQYVDTPMKNLEDAKVFVQSWYAPYSLNNEIQEINAQTSLEV